VGCALLSSEIVQITAECFSYQIASSAVFVLSNEIYLFQHSWGQSNQYFFGHLQFLAETKVDAETICDRYHQMVPVTRCLMYFDRASHWWGIHQPPSMSINFTHQNEYRKGLKGA
jgi:hypothetical protein